MIVQYKKGRFKPSFFIIIWQTLIFYFLKVIGVEEVLVEFWFSIESEYASRTAQNQKDWLKGWGAKSGFKTQSNKERIAAWRYDPQKDRFEICLYNRNKKEFYFTQKQHTKYYAFVKVPIKGLRYPAISWAGGNERPTQNFKIRINISNL